MTLLEGALDRPWTGNRLPVLYQQDRCLQCGQLAELMVMIQDPLFIHGGYGEAIRTVTRWCAGCHFSTVIRQETVRPHLP